MTWEETAAERIKSTLAELAADAGVTVTDGELHYHAWGILTTLISVDYTDSAVAAAVERVAVFADGARRLIAAIDRLEPEEARFLAIENKYELSSDLRLSLSLAERTIAEAPPLRKRPPRAKPEAQGVAKSALYAFEELTGWRATIVVDPVTAEARGRFLAFLRVVFDLLEIDASSEHFARKAIKED